MSVRIKERVATAVCHCVAETDSGGWGAWSGWTQCTSSCGGGTRSRFRFCDSPPPRYGAKFCEVSAVNAWTMAGSSMQQCGLDRKWQPLQLLCAAGGLGHSSVPWSGTLGSHTDFKNAFRNIIFALNRRRQNSR